MVVNKQTSHMIRQHIYTSNTTWVPSSRCDETVSIPAANLLTLQTCWSPACNTDKSLMSNTALFYYMPSVLWRCWLGGRKSIQPVKNLSDGMLAWLFVWSEVQMTCIWFSWCYWHPIISASAKSTMVHPSGTSSHGWSWTKGRKTVVVY